MLTPKEAAGLRVMAGHLANHYTGAVPLEEAVANLRGVATYADREDDAVLLASCVELADQLEAGERPALVLPELNVRVLPEGADADDVAAAAARAAEAASELATKAGVAASEARAELEDAAAGMEAAAAELEAGGTTEPTPGEGEAPADPGGDPDPAVAPPSPDPDPAG